MARCTVYLLQIKFEYALTAYVRKFKWECYNDKRLTVFCTKQSNDKKLTIFYTKQSKNTHSSKLTSLWENFTGWWKKVYSFHIPCFGGDNNRITLWNQHQ